MTIVPLRTISAFAVMRVRGGWILFTGVLRGDVQWWSQSQGISFRWVGFHVLNHCERFPLLPEAEHHRTIFPHTRFHFQRQGVEVFFVIW